MESSVTENNNFAPMVGKMEDEVFRSMKIDQNTKTPYSDATQVSRHVTIEIWVYLNGGIPSVTAVNHGTFSAVLDIVVG